MKTLYEVLDVQGKPITTVVVCEDFMRATYPNRWRCVQMPEVKATEARRITPLAFRNRFTVAEKARQELAAVDNPTDTNEKRQQAAVLRAHLADLLAAQFVDLDDGHIKDAVRSLAGMGLLTDERAEHILSNAAKPEEMP